MNAIEHTYVSLLADVADLSGFSEIRGSYRGLHWCLNEAPKLEKQLLASIEAGVKPCLDDVPEPLHRLYSASGESPMHLRLMRQLLLFSYKAYVTHDQSTTDRAIADFATANRDTGRVQLPLTGRLAYVLDRARGHCQSVLSRLNEKDILPHHGPGAVTTSKDVWRHWYPTIEERYPYSDYMCCYFNSDHASELDRADWVDEISAKLIAVPKDSRGPRLICVHPAESVWIQEGLWHELERVIALDRHWTAAIPRGKIRFRDQSVNGTIALLSSRSRRYATIDLKEASDRLSVKLVSHLFGDKYAWFDCCRARRFYTTEHSIGRLSGVVHSYAPMGNATTFPVQSLVFWSICVASMRSHGFHQPEAAFVFGDDIAIPSVMAPKVCEDLESFGLRINRNKSFWSGFFRESCGVDAFKGINVTPVRWKTTLAAEHLTGLLSLSDIAMRLRIAGYEEAATTAYAILKRRLWRDHRVRGMSFTGNPNHGGFAEFTYNRRLVDRDAFWHRGSQVAATPVLRVQEVTDRKARNCGWNHVLESLTSLERQARGIVPVRHVSRRVRLERGWIPKW
jgi:hypothetical protein